MITTITLEEKERIEKLRLQNIKKRPINPLIEKLKANTARRDKYMDTKYNSKEEFGTAIEEYRKLMKDINYHGLPIPTDDDCDNIIQYNHKLRSYLNTFNPDL